MREGKKEKILEWLNQNDKDYNQGVELLELATSAITANRFRRGNPALLLPHLVAFLRRITGPSFTSTVKTASPIPSVKSTASIPEPIRRAKDKLHDLWLRLVDYHKRLLALGFDNTDEKKKARVALMADRAPFVEAFEQLYLLKEEYFACRATGSKPVNRDSGSKPVKTNFSSLTPLELYKKRHALLMAITRRNNKPRFSQPTPAEQLNPMPDSPKRKAIESEIATLQQQLQEIDNLLQKKQS